VTLFPKITWAQPGGLAECPYFYRWVFDFQRFAVRIHHWLADDDHRAPHDHPYWFLTICLRGGYTDFEFEVDEGGVCTVKDIDVLRFGSIRFRPAEHLHSVQQVIPGTITILISGRPFRRWGFQFGGKKIMRDRYFAVQGHHPCDHDGEPVRLRPDGSRIVKN